MTKPYRYKKKVFPIGNSLAVTLPSIWCKANVVTQGETLVAEVYDDRVVITKDKKNGN